MATTAKQLEVLRRELGRLETQRRELCHRIAALYNAGRDEDSFDRAFELWQVEFQPLLERIQLLQRDIHRLIPPAPRHRVNGRLYPRARRVVR
jgi:hypothetical protein